MRPDSLFLLLASLVAMPALAADPPDQPLRKCRQADVRKCPGFSELEKKAAADPKLLLDLAGSEHRNGQIASLRIMEQQGPDDKALGTLLGSADSEVVTQAMTLAGNSGRNGLAPAILERTRSAADTGPEEVLLRGIAVLGMLRHEPAMDFLMQKAGDPSARVSRSAVQALGRVGGEGISQMLEKRARDTSLPPESRKAAIAGLGGMRTSEAVAALVDLTRSEEGDLRRAAVVALGQTGDRSAVPGLFEMLRVPGLERELFESLARLGGEQAGSMLMAAHDDPTRPEEIRFLALCAAGRTGHPGALDPLLPHLKAASFEERRLAIEALAGIPGDGAVAALLERIRKGDEQERQLAFWAVKSATGKALETEKAIQDYLESQLLK
ncbi:MAG: HEAT repeat domain-containing protein [Deltaproteobacteria bacterium]|nr:HEAT repeat domain-containing protein [Deltaproteobacteria bacterium]